jgi:two-component system response regulator FixJ
MPKAGVMAEPTIVHIVDDDADVRESLQLLLNGAGYRCESYASGDAFLSAAPKISVTCAIVDVRMPGMDGLALMSEMRERKLQIPVILATGFGDVPLAVRAMKAGAVDFIEKPCRISDLQDAIVRALAIAERGRKDATEGEEAARRLSRLTQRERGVFDRLILGDSNKTIANHLSISTRTVEIHRARVMEKLQAKSLPELVRLALAANAESSVSTTDPAQPG